MKTKQILQLDYRAAENRAIIQNVLRQIKPLKKCPDGDIPADKLERCLKVLCNKYGVYSKCLMPDMDVGDKYIVWRSEMFQLDGLVPLETVYGCTFYEVLAKSVIMLYSMTRNRGQDNEAVH